MTIRVRFAPSPTGYLHIGGARTALYNWLFARASGGRFILRVEDTDLERSKREYEELQLQDLAWLGINHDEGPDRPNPKYAPYRQSERLDIYQKHAQQLIDKGLAYYDFCTEEQLEEMKERATREGRPPQYEGKWKNPAFHEEALNKLAAGEKAAIRFRAPEKAYVLNDMVKDRVVYPQGMVGDFVILRSNGLPVYNFCCVVDDVLMEITHVIRGEDHLSNTVRQLMIYEALGKQPPVFAHVSLLIGQDRQKLSKRHGATSVHLYKEEHYLPEALCNYLTLLGWSHPQEKDIFSKHEIAPIFDLTRFSASAAIYDLVKLKWVNGQHLRQLPNEVLVKELSLVLAKEHLFHAQSEDWKLGCVNLLKQQVEFIADMAPLIDQLIFQTEVEMSDELKEILSWPSTAQIISLLKLEFAKINQNFMGEVEFNQLSELVKKNLSLKGKPLFMGLRAALTGKGHGPELKFLIPLTPVQIIRERLSQIGS